MRSKGRMRELLEKMPVYIVDEEIGALGAEEFACRKIK